MLVAKVKATRGDAQLGLRFRKDKNGRNRGGARAGAGRRRGPRPAIRHRPRPPLRKGVPVHISLRIQRDAAGLRRRKQHQAIRAVLRQTGCKDGFRICHYSIQGDHLHLLVEAADRQALAAGMKSIGARLARAVNRVFGRKGPVLFGRYLLRALRTPRDVRNALAYVLLNARKHWRQRHGIAPPVRLDEQLGEPLGASAVDHVRAHHATSPSCNEDDRRSVTGIMAGSPQAAGGEAPARRGTATP